MTGRGTVIRLGTAIGLASALLLAAQADAAQRYASPGGNGTTCSQAAPCHIFTAVALAGPTDEVIVSGGTYTLGNTPLTVDDVMNVHGAAGQAVPRLEFGAPSGGALTATNLARIARLRVEASTGRAVTVTKSATAEQLYAHASGTNGVACTVTADLGTGDAAFMRDSACWSSGTGGNGLVASGNGAVTLRNVTAVGSFLGLLADAPSSGDDLVVDVRNSVMDGPGFADIGSYPSGFLSTVSVPAARSNYATVNQSNGGSIVAPGTAGNQTTPPLFADAPAGDFRQLQGSPTIDQGAADGLLGTLDFEGDARVQGGAPDIGADESDGIPPQTTIKKGPKGKTKSRKAKFKFGSSEGGATFECKLDKGKFKPCASPKSYKKLKPGKHTFKVRANDAFGNADASPAAKSWRVK